MSSKVHNSIITAPSLLLSLFAIAATYLIFFGFNYLFVFIGWFIEDSDFLYYVFAFLFEYDAGVTLFFLCCAASSFLSFRIVVYIFNAINKIDDRTRKIVFIISGCVMVVLNISNLTYIIFDNFASVSFYHFSALLDFLWNTFGDYDGAFFQNFFLSLSGVAFIAKSHSFHTVYKIEQQ